MRLARPVTTSACEAQCVLLDWGLTKQLSEQRRLAACSLVLAGEVLALLAACQNGQDGEAHSPNVRGRAVYNALRIQVVRVDRQGRLQLSMATGCVSYTSWQPLHENDPFPLGCTVLGAPLLAAAIAKALQKRGIALNSPAKTLLWPKYSGPLTVGDVLLGRKAICSAPPRASTRMLADLGALMKWLETAPAADGPAPAWWPLAEREAASAWILKNLQQQPGTLLEVVCLANHPAMRESERCSGLSTSASSAAVAALHVAKL
eukprot:Skav208996  [mRNA]  locus=scaffold2686:144365:155089:- [translate_table: standard]